MIKKILLDTNFLLIPAQFKVDIYSEIARICNFQYELYVMDKTIIELNNIINEGKGKNREAAKLAKSILEAKKPKILKTSAEDYVDNIILGLKGYIVATQDKALRSMLKKHNVKTIVLRQKNHLVLE
jgi:hypothetical protein